MQDKSKLHKALAQRKRMALQYALEREQWSHGLRRQHIELHDTELERLKSQLDTMRAERDDARQSAVTLTRLKELAEKEIETLKASLSAANRHLDESRRQPAQNAVDAGLPLTGRRNDNASISRTMAAAALSVFAVAALFTSDAFHDAQSKVKENDQAETAAVTALETLQAPGEQPVSADNRKVPPQSGKKKTRFAKVKPASQRQWGPPLLMADPDVPRPHVVFDPEVKKLQDNLLTLGFDLGESDGFEGLRTRLAIDEFRALYLPEGASRPKRPDLLLITQNYANLARSDADRFGMDRGVVAAIRLSSVRTGVEFSYLMKLAATESNFEPDVESGTSSATGIYQFTQDTWLNVLKKHGASYGLADYTAKISYYVTRGGYQRPMVEDKALLKHLLNLRKNPRISAMMAAESVRDSQKRLAHLLDRQPAQADLYLTHFLGADGAVTFLKTLEKNPETFAVDLFPEAARSNQSIFHPKTCNPRTVDEVYELFGAKFSSRRYDDIASN